MNILGVFNLERRGDDLMNFFPNGEEEINLLKFLARYQYLRIEDAKYFFKSKKYYRTRISSLIKKHYLCKNKSNINTNIDDSVIIKSVLPMLLLLLLWIGLLVSFQIVGFIMLIVKRKKFKLP